MDQSPERGVLAPEARDLEGLAEELEDGLVLLKEGEVAGYVGLYPFWDGAALEGPLAYREEDLPPLLEAAEGRAREVEVERLYAFPREENRVLRQVLEEAGFGLLHVTYFFVKRPEGLDHPAPEGVRVEPLAGEARVQEIARLLSGAYTQAALAHARELLEAQGAL